MTFYLNQSTASLRRIPFELYDSTGAPITGSSVSFTNPPATGQVQLSKAGGTYTDVTGSVVEIGNGSWYYQGVSGDFDTLGLLILKVNKATAQLFKYQDEVVNTPATKTDTDTINTTVNTINTTTNSTNTTVGTINTTVNTINTTTSSTNTTVGTINTNVNTINTTVGTINTTVGTINTNVNTINTNVNTANTNLTAALGLLNDNSVIDNLVYSGTNLTSSRVRVFSSKANALAATPGAANNADGETQRYLMTATYSGSNMTAYTLVKDL